MRNRQEKKSGKQNSVMLATLGGFLLVAVLGAWLVMSDADKPRNGKPVKPTVEVSR